MADITQDVLRDLAARIGQLTVRVAVLTAERDVALAEIKRLTPPVEEETR